MNGKLIFTALILIALFASLATAQVRESFDYPAGSVVDGLGSASGGWAGPWQYLKESLNVDSAMFVVDTAFDYSDVQVNVPKSGLHMTSVLKSPNSKIRQQRFLDHECTIAVGNTYWISALEELWNDASISSWCGISLYDSLNERPLLGKGWGDGVYSFGGGTPSANEKSSATWDNGPVWLVARIDGNDGNIATLHMWVNPDPTNGEPDTSTADTRSRYTSFSKFNSIVMAFGDYSGKDDKVEMSIDEIRFGTTWDDVSSVFPGAGVASRNTNPMNYTLYQNYPNPFNPSTKISYSLKNTGKVRLSVFDMLGREVAVLVNSTQNAGVHNVTFSASKLVSGIYMYRLEADNNILSKKMVLMK